MSKDASATERKSTQYIVLRALDISQADDGTQPIVAWQQVGSYSALNNELAKRMAAGDLLAEHGGEFPQGEITLVAVPASSFKPTTGRVEIAQPRLVMSAA